MHRRSFHALKAFRTETLLRSGCDDDLFGADLLCPDGDATVLDPPRAPDVAAGELGHATGQGADQSVWFDRSLARCECCWLA
jgi:hypothetical protein